MRRRRPLLEPCGGVRSQSFRRQTTCTHKIVSPLFRRVVLLMSRAWDPKKFDSIYAKFICQSAFAVHFGPPGYYLRYRSRYKTLVKRFCYLAPATPVDVLDIGGGQLALLCKHLWADRAYAADINIGGAHFDYLRSQGVQALQWDLCKADQPFVGQFDF